MKYDQNPLHVKQAALQVSMSAYPPLFQLLSLEYARISDGHFGSRVIIHNAVIEYS